MQGGLFCGIIRLLDVKYPLHCKYDRYIKYMITSQKAAIFQTKQYIMGKKLGLTKGKAAGLAGYSPSTQRVPAQIESSNTYTVLIKAMSEENAMSMWKISKNINKDVDKGEMAQKTLTKTQILKNLAQVQEILTPKVTMKEVRDAQGKVTKTTKWGSGMAKQATITEESKDVEEDMDVVSSGV